MSRVCSAFVSVCVVTLGLLAADSAEAQFRRPQGGFGGFGGQGGSSDPISLLNNQAIRQELELEGDQAEDLTAINREMREELEQEISALRAKVQEKYQGRIDKVLLPHQADRLQQISIQFRGTEALTDPQVAKELGLSQAQIDQIEKKREGAREEMQTLFRPEGGERPDFSQLREKMQKFREEQRAAVLGVLTSAQQSKFQEMQGKEFDRSQLFRGRGRGGRGGRGGDNN